MEFIGIVFGLLGLVMLVTGYKASKSERFMSDTKFRTRNEYVFFIGVWFLIVGCFMLISPFLPLP
ncbi:MAG: hypothetical protein GW762_05325 [Candidatus Pacebacteria bacterium]|nr:hypothetical protein [Candidatus Paceibacterota bacterium]